VEPGLERDGLGIVVRRGLNRPQKRERKAKAIDRTSVAGNNTPEDQKKWGQGDKFGRQTNNEAKSKSREVSVKKRHGKTPLGGIGTANW